MEPFVKLIEKSLFSIRPIVILFFFICTCLLGWSASQIKVDAGFEKNIPLEHEYMKTFVDHQELFGGANRVMIAVQNTRGDIFTPEFFDVLRKVNDELFFLEGVDRSKVTSLFTPNTRFIEVVEDGFAGGPVIPADFKSTKEGLEQVRKNAIKAGIVGRFVSNDFSCAMVAAQLLEVNPNTGKRLDYIQFAQGLENKIREKYQTDDIKIHIIGFTKMIGDVVNGTRSVVMFFALALLITSILVYAYSRSIKLTALPIICSIVAVIWQMGLLNALGFGLDPMAILVPFLVFAIGVSHGMQMINRMGNEIAKGNRPIDAAKTSFRRLLIPGGIALISDTVGFLTLLLIKIGVIRELAINASLGVAVIILTNLILLPVLLSYMKINGEFYQKRKISEKHQEKLWKALSKLSYPKYGRIVVVCSLILFIVGVYYARQMKIGDLHAGAPALHADSTYNMDTALIVDKFSIGVDAISVIVESNPDSCIQYDKMEAINRFHWHMENVEGVQSVVSLSEIAKIINAAFNEGNPNWRILSRNTAVLTQATTPVKSSSGLLNTDCSVMPVIIFTRDHKAETIERVVAAVKEYTQKNPEEGIRFRLATGPVGVMAAKNEAVSEAQMPMLFWVYGAVICLCLLTFRSVKATLCVVLPLILVSALAQSLMVWLEIGLTVSTMPILALGVGIGVDYGIYIISPMLAFMKEGLNVHEAYLKTLKTTGSAVMFTGFTLAVGVSTWIFSELKFQADIGILLTFMFLLNMLGAILILPAIASLLMGKQSEVK